MANDLVTLREERPSDAAWLWHWRVDAADAEWRRWDGPYFHDSEERVSLAEFSARRPEASPHRRIIALGDEPVGTVTRHEEDPAGGGWWELGIVIFDPRHWGRGLGRAALRAWTTDTFEHTDAHVITLTSWSGNERLLRSAAALGYAECARIPEARPWDGRRWDSVKLAVLRRDWASDQG